MTLRSSERFAGRMSFCEEEDKEGKDDDDDDDERKELFVDPRFHGDDRENGLPKLTYNDRKTR